MPFQGQWADSLLALERAYYLRVAIWALASILAGTVLMAWLRVRNLESVLVRAFALHSIIWGGTLLTLATWAVRTASLRDLAGATALDRRVWFCVGLGLGIVALGAALARLAYSLDRRLGLVGTGVAISVQGSALTLLSLQFAAALVR